MFEDSQATFTDGYLADVDTEHLTAQTVSKRSTREERKEQQDSEIEPEDVEQESQWLPSAQPEIVLEEEKRERTSQWVEQGDQSGVVTEAVVDETVKLEALKIFDQACKEDDRAIRPER